MKNIKLYTKTFCQHCNQSLKLLTELKLSYTEITVDHGSEEFEKLKKQTGHTTVPMIFFGSELIGGNQELQKLNNSNALYEKLREK